MAAACLALAACAPKPAPAPEPAPVASEPDPLHHEFAPKCNLNGCCEGHGAVAYLQPDKFVMCTDGETSRICDCH